VFWVVPAVVGTVGVIAILVSLRSVARDAARLASSLAAFGEFRQPVLELRAEALALRADALELRARPLGSATSALPARPGDTVAS
jgi:hypothetical protein